MQEVCPTCGGRRYNQAVLKFRWHDYTIADLLDLSVDSAMPVLASQPAIASTLQTLHDMGLGYLHLGESTPALSGGEAQRLRLTSHMGKTQRGTLFVFDEPSIGLHPLDVQVLLQVFQRLIDQGGTVLTIAHDLDIMANATRFSTSAPAVARTAAASSRKARPPKSLRATAKPVTTSPPTSPSFNIKKSPRSR